MPLTDREFYDLVADLRHHQREYFRTKSGKALAESKRLEKAVDAALWEHNGQKQLFPKEPVER